MSSELPSGDLAVFGFLEMFALAFAFSFVENLGTKPWYALIYRVILALFFFVAGIKWPLIRPKLGPRFATIASHRLFRQAIYAVIVGALLVTTFSIAYRRYCLSPVQVSAPATGPSDRVTTNSRAPALPVSPPVTSPIPSSIQKRQEKRVDLTGEQKALVRSLALSYLREHPGVSDEDVITDPALNGWNYSGRVASN